MAMGKTKKASAKGSRRWLKWLILGPILLVLLVQLYFFIMVCWYSVFNPGSTAFMRQQLSELREKKPDAQLKHEWVPYERISVNLKRAVVASEDSRFAEHGGVDWEALEKAYERNNKRSKVVGGGSTITQQLAKNLFLSGSRSYLRKGQEMIIAFMLETVMSKRRILEVYLNVAEFGEGTFGVEAAARRHFGIPASELSDRQAALLAAILPAPKTRDPANPSEELSARAARIQDGAATIARDGRAACFETPGN